MNKQQKAYAERSKAFRVAKLLEENDPAMFEGYVDDIGSVDYTRIGEWFLQVDPDFSAELLANHGA